MPVNKGLSDSIYVKSLAISGGYIFAGTYRTGVWKRSLSDILGVNEVGGQKSEVGIEVYPNPANSLLVVSYSLLEKSSLNIGIYDLMGNEVVMLVNQEEEKGEYKIEFDAGKLGSGVYFCKLVAGNSTMTRKIVIVH